MGQMNDGHPLAVASNVLVQHMEMRMNDDTAW